MTDQRTKWIILYQAQFFNETSIYAMVDLTLITLLQYRENNFIYYFIMENNKSDFYI